MTTHFYYPLFEFLELAVAHGLWVVIPIFIVICYFAGRWRRHTVRRRVLMRSDRIADARRVMEEQQAEIDALDRAREARRSGTN